MAYKPYQAAHLSFGEPETPGAIAEGQFFGGAIGDCEWAMFRDGGEYVVCDLRDRSRELSRGVDAEGALEGAGSNWDVARWLVSEDATFAFIPEDTWDSAMFEEVLDDEPSDDLARAIREYQEECE